MPAQSCRQRNPRAEQKHSVDDVEEGGEDGMCDAVDERGRDKVQQGESGEGDGEHAVVKARGSSAADLLLEECPAEAEEDGDEAELDEAEDCLQGIHDVCIIFNVVD